MSVSRLDLDEVGSGSGLAAKIHELCPDLPLNFDIEALCRQLDIEQIKRIDTDAFAAALVTDENKAFGSILLSSRTGRRRARFSSEPPYSSERRFVARDRNCWKMPSPCPA